MKAVSLTCPKCGGNLENLQVAEGKNDTYCSFCGNHILLENENFHVIEHRTVDAARIREMELEAENIAQQRKIIITVGKVLSGIALVCGVYGWLFKDSTVSIVALLAVVGLMNVALMFGTIGNKSRNKQDINN